MTQATTPPFQPQAFAAAEGLERQRAWVDVDPGAITANARSLRRCLEPTTNLMAVDHFLGTMADLKDVVLQALHPQPQSR